MAYSNNMASWTFSAMYQYKITSMSHGLVMSDTQMIASYIFLFISLVNGFIPTEKIERTTLEMEMGNSQ